MPDRPPTLHGKLKVCPVPGGKPISAEFNPTGHLYTTFMVAHMAGMDSKRATFLTYYSQLPDMDSRLDAVSVSIWGTLLPWKWGDRHAITSGLHSLHGGDPMAVRRRRAALGRLVRTRILAGDEEALREAGLLIHAMGDAYAHTKGDYGSPNESAYGEWVGHFWDGHTPDELARPRVFPKYAAYVDALYQTLGGDDGKGDRHELEAYLCSLRTYVCPTAECGSEAVEQMDAAVGAWSRRLGELDSGMLERLLSDQRLDLAVIRKLAREIEETSAEPSN